MKNRTIYDVLNEAMEDYTYSIKKEGNKVEIKGSMTIPRINIEVAHEKIFYYTSEDRLLLGDGANAKLAKVIANFKEELKDKVASVIKEHQEELTDDAAMIKNLQYENKTLRDALSETEEELKKVREENTRLQLEKLSNPQQPQPYDPYQPQPYPWYPSPWSTGITWDTPYVGDPPGWLDNITTCDSLGGYIYNNTNFTTQEGLEMNHGEVHYTTDKTAEHPERIRYRKFKHNRKNGGER